MARESQPARTGLTLALNKDIWRANFYRFCQLLEQENPDAPKLGTTSHPATTVNVTMMATMTTRSNRSQFFQKVGWLTFY